MASARRQETLEIPDEPPPPYEPISPNVADGTSTFSAEPESTAQATPSTIQPETRPVAIASTTTGTNPFLAPSEIQQSTTSSVATGNSVTATSTGTSTSHNPFETATLSSALPSAAPSTSRPPLPPRNNAASSVSTANTQSTVSTAAVTPASPALSISQSTSGSHRVSSDSRPASIAAPLSPNPTSPIAPSSPSAFRPPPGPPPSTSSGSTSSSTRPRPQDQYRPTTVPTPGQPLLRKGKLLVYPRNWTGCPKCHDTGYKQADPSNPCKKCWDKYGKTYTPAMSYASGLSNSTSVLQKPLPERGYGAPSARPPHGLAGPSHGYVPGGYPGAAPYNAIPSPGAVYPGSVPYGPQPYMQGYPPHHSPYQQPYSPPQPPQPRPPTSPPATTGNDSVDAETAGARMSDVPPNYQDASSVPQDERLPSQYVPPAAPPPGAPGARPPHSPPLSPPGGYAPGHPPRPYAMGYPGQQPGFVGGFSSNPGGPNPHVAVQHYGMLPPPGALVVMPGDPRIGGRLCYECGGDGVRESFWFGDETCFRCQGSGRIF
ncbi:hypothetical protein BCV70DRAFT_202695 [Testicularia cyperi]|uniref:Uncharacterized protein n=1 Tax=Testicularia cyperi TaxID=1882483 RepID=A0A317XK25_9BASI|nr:hypothetical protein BCV70DRAFT_202695 [Testicularia cyperi]